MKIYINHFNLLILNNILKQLADYRINTEEYIQFYSPDGIYIVDKSNTFKLNAVDHDIMVLENYYNNLTLIVDPSFYIVEKVVQMPTEFISTRMKRETFVLSNSKVKDVKDVKEEKEVKEVKDVKKEKRNTKLIIESEIINQKENEFSFLNNNTVENDYKPKDIYFELPNGTNIDNILVKEELIVFLSLLN